MNRIYTNSNDQIKFIQLTDEIINQIIKEKLLIIMNVRKSSQYMLFILIIEINLYNIKISLQQYRDKFIIIMKRTCSGHKDAQYICINKLCSQNCSYICSIPSDKCKIEHQSCQQISLSYLLKKASKISTKSKSLSSFKTFYNRSQNLIKKLSNIFQNGQACQRIGVVLDTHGLVQRKDKEIIYNFLNKQTKQQEIEDVSLGAIEKQLFNLNTQINQCLKSIKQGKVQQITGSNFFMLKPKSRINQSEKKQGSDIRPLSKGPTPVKSELRESRNLKLQSKLSPQIGGFDVVMSSVIKNHVPVGPLFSKITNDIQTLQTFFYQKFLGASLLYRASQHSFSALKFHQLCDNHPFTLTLLITQHNKTIGGYTPLPWKSNGDWYEDQSLSTFIFNLTSGERYPLLKKDKAIWCSQGYGPSFGQPDLEIADKAYYNNNSCVNFPNCYNNGNYNQSQASNQLLCGAKNGHFRIKEWEVYQLDFGKH